MHDAEQALRDLARTVDKVEFHLPGDALSQRRDLRDDLLASIREYLLPRLSDLDAPAVAVLVGPTGAGKSTLLNALAGREVTRAGVLRPTTRQPVVWTHTDHADRYGVDMLPSFSRRQPLDVVTHEDPTMTGVTVVDAPDLDSVETANRELAEELLGAADLCIFVTSAQRYADAIPWEVLQGVRDRDLPLVVVCNRLPDVGGDEILADLRRRLRHGGIEIGDDVVMAIAEQPLATMNDDGLPDEAVAGLRRRLADLADPEVRRRVIVDAVRSGLTRTGQLALDLAEAVEAEQAEQAALLGVADEAYTRQREAISKELRDGELIRGEVLARWQDYVGTGELLRVMTEGIGRLRTWTRTVFGGQGPRVDVVQAEAEASLADTIARRADRAAASTATAWELSAAGRALIEPSLWRADEQTAVRAARAVEDWLAGLAAMVEELGVSRRRTAKAASVGVNVAAATAMLAVFSQTGGLTGAEVGITAGAAALQQRVLEHVFGAAAARRLITEGREQLEIAIAGVLGTDQQRFVDVVARTAIPDSCAAELRAGRLDVGRAGGLLLTEVARDG